MSPQMGVRREGEADQSAHARKGAQCGAVVGELEDSAPSRLGMARRKGREGRASKATVSSLSPLFQFYQYCFITVMNFHHYDC